MYASKLLHLGCGLWGALSVAWDPTKNARVHPREAGEHTEKENLPAGGAELGSSPEDPTLLQSARGRGV